MYVTPDISGVEIKILGAAAQPLGAKIEILGVLAQPLAWRKTVAHKDGNSWRTLAYTLAPQDIRLYNIPNFNESLYSSYKVNYWIFPCFDMFSYSSVLIYFSLDT